jgi:hypothetical protein
MATAVPAHLRRPTEPFAALVGPFLCPASRVAERYGSLQSESRFVPDGGRTHRRHRARLRRGGGRRRAGGRAPQLRMVEVPVPADGTWKAGAAGRSQVPAEVPLYVELPAWPAGAAAGAPRRRAEGPSCAPAGSRRAVPVRS